MKKIVTEKLWTLMKIGTIQLLLATITCVITLAHTTHAQLLEQKLSISVHEESFDSILYQIETKTNVKFAFSIDQLQVEEKITLVASNQSLKQILEQLLEPYDIGYKLHESENTITLKKKASNAIQYTTPLGVQQIEGLVTDAQQQPLAGVNIIISGTTNGTTTNAEGRYSLFVNEGDVVVFSFIGFTTQSVTIKNQTILDIVMTEDLESLKEVVVNAGYWEVKDIERTGNISRIDAEIIEKQPVNNPLQAMQGRMPGVYIQQNTGVPGGGFKIQIRGENSLRSNGNDPLYVIDGVPFTATPLTSTSISGSIIKEGNPLSAINPNDIESIEVLKDGDATAIYGSRGANGVVLITTKKGQEGRTKFDATVIQGFGKVSHFMDVLNTTDYVDMRIEGMQNDGIWPPPVFLQQFIFDIFAWDTTRYTDWQKEFIGGTAYTTNAQFSVSGGNSNTQFNLSGGYFKESTVFPGDFNFQRFSGNLNLNHTSENNKLNAAITIGYWVSLNNLFPRDLTNTALTLAPNAPALYKEDGSLNWDWNNNFIQNPLAITLRKYNSNTNNLLANGVFSYEVIPGLHVKTNLGFTTMYVDEVATNPLSAIPPQTLTNQTASATFGTSNLNTWIIEPQISYLKEWGIGKLNILIGTTFQESKQEGQTLFASGYTSDALLDNKQAATTARVTSANFSQYRYSAIFGRINYNLQDKYILNLTGRRDGSSRFGPGKQFGNFGAIGGAWLFSNENFMNNTKSVISMGKLRISYGTTGSDAIGNYQYLDTYSATTYPYNNTNGLVVTRLNNPDYSWETNHKFEVGLETSLWKDHINFSVSWYDNKATNQLVGLPLPVLSGQPSVQYNLPATVQNTGWEVQVATTNIQNKNFSWKSGFNITVPKNKLLEFPGLEGFPAYNNQYKVGESIYTKKTLKSTGVDPLTGIYTFEDVSGDGNISLSNDGLFLKEVTQKFFGGLFSQFSYKDFQLDVFFQFVKQTGYNYKSIFLYPGASSNQPVEVLARWQETGEMTDIQRFAFSGAASTAYINLMSSDQAISDASFIRLKNISLTWSIPRVWTDKVKFKNASIFIQAQNLLTFTKYLGMDPENQNVNYLPPLRTIATGIQIGL